MWKEKHLSSPESSKTSENNYVNEYIASLKDQIESLKGEILFLRQELRLRNVPPKCIVSIGDDTEFHNINKGNNNNHNKNENSSNNSIN